MDMAKKHTIEPVAPRIRYYIYGIIRENCTESVRIPSSYELAKMFGTSRRIVQYELERLIAEGVLIGRERIGTFTNPLSSYSFNVSRDKMRLVGVTYGSGDHFTYAHEGAYSIAALYRELIKRDCYVHDLRLTNKSPDSMLRDIVSLGLDGVIWLFPRLNDDSRLFQNLIASGIRLVSCGHKCVPGVNSVGISGEKACIALRERFLAEKRIRILCLADPNYYFFQAIETVFNAAPFQLFGGGYDEHRMSEILDERLAEFGVPDVLFCHAEIAAALGPELRKRNIDTENRCRLVALREFSHSADFQGCILHPPYEEIAKHATDILLDMMDSPTPAIRHEIWECTFTFQGIRETALD